MPKPDSLSADQARRIALAAQGFCDPRPTGRVDRRHLRRVLDRVGLVQIDSVNVLARSHYLPFFSRLGPYDRQMLIDLAARHKEVVEYWGHMASFVPVDTWPDFVWRMHDEHAWSGVRQAAHEQEYLAWVRDAVHTRGPVTANDLEERNRPKEPWWDWSRAKRALEQLFHAGEITALRRGNFERVYVPLERVLPAEAIARRDRGDLDAARRACLLLGARCHGVGTAHDIADYPRMKVTQARPILRELAAEGVLLEVEVEGWDQPAYLHPDARLPRRVDARALLSPFDSLVWERDRTERLFGFHYRIEIYVPKPKRVHGYFVLPFLLGDRLVGRVDLKADRAGGRLLVQASHVEPDAEPPEVAEALAAELADMAAWLELDTVEVVRRGELAPFLAEVVGSAGSVGYNGARDHDR